MNTGNKHQYDLEERTAIFAEKTIELCKKTPKNIMTISIVGQLIRSGTSVGANYHEANGASSRKDFTNKIFLCKKEAKETQYWLRLLAKTVTEEAPECRLLWQEAKELAMIFGAIASKTKAD